MGFYFVARDDWVTMTGGLLWQWIGGHLPGCGGDEGLGVRGFFVH